MRHIKKGAIFNLINCSIILSIFISFGLYIGNHCMADEDPVARLVQKAKKQVDGTAPPAPLTSLINEVVALGDKAVDGLVPLLREEDFFIRDIATEALCRIGTKRGLEAVFNAIKEGHGGTSEVVEVFSRKENREYWPRFEELLASKNSFTRMKAASILGRASGPKYTSLLSHQLKNTQEPGERWWLFGILYSRKDKEVIKTIIADLKSDNPRIRKNAITFLGVQVSSEDKAKFDINLHLLKSLKDPRNSAKLKASIIRSFARTGDKHFVSEIAPFLYDKTYLSSPKKYQVRKKEKISLRLCDVAANAIGRLLNHPYGNFTEETPLEVRDVKLADWRKWHEGKKKIEELPKEIGITKEVKEFIQKEREKHEKLEPKELCASNLREIGKALMMYATDYNGRFPPALQHLYGDYIFSPATFWCSLDKDPKPLTVNNNRIDAENSTRISYQYNSGLSINDDPKLPVVWDNGCNGPRDNHGNKGGHVVYLDGRVEWVPAKEWKKPAHGKDSYPGKRKE